MRVRHSWVALILVVVALAALAVPAFGQGAPQDQLAPIVVPEAPTAVEVAPVAAPGQARSLTYLPVLIRSPAIEIRLGASANPDTGEVTAPNTVFSTGITRLYVDVRLRGVQGLPYRTEVVTASGQRLRGATLTGSRPVHYSRFYVCRTLAGSCGFGEVALLAGTYKVEVFLGEALASAAEGTIR